nr:metallophosphoesterase 1-like isoform X2 [Quercus suber]
MLLVLGDVSAKGSELTRSKWVSVLHQFHGLLGPFIGLPYHVILGDRDIGECSELNVKSVNWMASNFPGLDSAGCGAFEIINISFVSLNAVALLCGNNNLRFGVEKVVERESVDLQMETEGAAEVMNTASKLRETDHNFGWKESSVSSGSGPVLLLHFPLYQAVDCNCSGFNAFKRTLKHSLESSNMLGSRRLVETGPYKLSQTLPRNATEYIFQALKPRENCSLPLNVKGLSTPGKFNYQNKIVFSAHTHEFCDQLHSDGTREVSVPAMTWNARDDPGFVVATFHRNRRAVSVSYCSLARESHVIIAYVSFVVLFLSTTPLLRYLRIL